MNQIQRMLPEKSACVLRICIQEGQNGPQERKNVEDPGLTV
jgi:hypothetical protein